MQIACPHCTTSFSIKPSTLGAAGRNVRCSRCKKVWLARPEDMVDAVALAPAMAEAESTPVASDPAAEWAAMAREEEPDSPPHVESPPISAALPDEKPSFRDMTDWESVSAKKGAGRRRGRLRLPSLRRLTLPAACMTMAAMVAVLFVWRADIVRLMPQTALFYKAIGLDVNLRGLVFRDIKVTNETVDGKPVLVIEGMIVGESRKPVEIPRLRFAVRDAQGAEIYAWNTVLEQAVLHPGERAHFKSRLASPPPEGRDIDVRFFNKRDIAGGRA